MYIDKNSGDAKKIYYTSLLPKKINSILALNKGEKSASETLYTFPENNEEKIKIFTDHQIHKEKQSVMLSGPRLNIHDLMKEGNIENYTLLFIGDPKTKDIISISSSLFKINELYTRQSKVLKKNNPFKPFYGILKFSH